MPRKEGKTSTRLVYPLKVLAVASFLMESDHRAFSARRCVVEGCKHQVRSCHEGEAAGPAVVVLLANIDKQVGLICQHHVAELLALPE